MTLDIQRVKRLMRGRFGAPLRLAYTGAERAELAVLAAVDRARSNDFTTAERAEVAHRVTMTVKTFERPRVLRRCLASARLVFDGRIVVADDSREPVTDVGENVDVLALPFNAGVSVGRNAALDEVRTEFVFVSDDDIVFTVASDMVAAMNFLDDHPEVDIVALTLVDLPRLRAVARHGEGALFHGAKPPKIPYGTLIEGQPVVSKTPQLYLARTASIQKVRWDERLRMVDHRDFFSRAAGVLVSVQATTIHAYHLRTPFAPFYTAHREDVAGDLQTLARLWGGSRPTR